MNRGRYPTDFLNNTLDNIELVTTDDDFLALIQSVKGIQLGLNSGEENISRNACRVDTDGTVVHGSDVTFDVNTSLIGGGFIAANSNAGRDEVTRVGIGLETDKVRAEHSFENLHSA